MQQKHLVAVVAVLALFLDLVDLTIVNVALPTLQRTFDAGPDAVAWTVTAYVLSLAVFMAASGWVADRFGAKRTFLFALAAFTAGSALCAAAWSLPSLVAFRAVQGIGGGLLVPVGMATLFRAYPEDERATASAVFSTPAALAPAIGPLLGGVLIDTLSWRWVFLVNVPVGLVALVLAARWLEEHTEPDAGRFDAPGFVLGGAGLVALTLAIVLIPGGGLSGGPAVALVVAALVLLGTFARTELRTGTPLVDLRLLGGRAFGTGTAIMGLSAVAFGGTLVVLPLLLQDQLGMSAGSTGVLLAFHALGIMVATPLAARFSDRLGQRRTLAGGLIVTGLITAALTLIGDGTSSPAIAGLLFVAGAAFGTSVVPLQTLPFDGMDAGALTRGTAILSVVRQTGLAFGTAILATVVGAGLAAGGDPIDAYVPAFLVAAIVSLVAAAVVSLTPDRRRGSATRSARARACAGTDG